MPADLALESLIAQPNAEVAVVLSDGPITLSARVLLFNLCLWRPLMSRGLPVARRHLFEGGVFTKATIKTIHTEIYEDILTHRPHERLAVQAEMLEDVNRLFNLIATRMGAYQVGISGYRLAKLLQNPELQAVNQPPVMGRESNDVYALHTQLQGVNDQVLDTLKRRDLTDNALYPFLRVGTVNPQQLVQVLVAGGARTDIDDTMIQWPLLSSYHRGKRNILDEAVDSIMAKKSLFYNAMSLPTSQYENRKMQLLLSTFRHIYPGSCGNPLVVPFEVMGHFSQRLIGKYHQVAGEDVLITRANHHQLVGSTIQLVSALTCRHTDGVCHRCGGRMLQYMPPNSNPGLSAVISLMGPVAQLLLSNKHVSKAQPLRYRLPPDLDDVFRVVRNEIHLQPGVSTKNLAIVVPFQAMNRVGDLEHIDDTTAINDQHFSAIGELMLADATTGKLHTVMVPLTQGGRGKGDKQKPYFSAAILTYIAAHPHRKRHDQYSDTIWIDLSEFDASQPVLRTVMASDSMVRFVNQTSRLFGSGIAEYTSLTTILRDAANLIYRVPSVTPHFLYLELVIRASLITDAVDYSVPVVEDIHQVRFNKLGRLIPRRSIGAQFAYQGTADYLADPSTYLIPRETGPFDVYLGFRD